MAYMKVNGRKDMLSISNDQARRLKLKLAETQNSENEMIDLGVWFGALNQIKSVEMESEHKTPKEDYNRPLTHEERENAKVMMARVRANLEARGVLKTSFSPISTRCDECHCSVKRVYVCRHACAKCLSSNPENL